MFLQRLREGITVHVDDDGRERVSEDCVARFRRGWVFNVYLTTEDAPEAVTISHALRQLSQALVSSQPPFHLIKFTQLASNHQECLEQRSQL